MTCPHYCDNQGLCHQCGILMEPEWWVAYAGYPHPDDDRTPSVEFISANKEQCDV